ncbi:MAG: hypothetical protein EOQ50_14135 [Mesorhizobium sp.]|uniref:ABC-three component system protein n=1 Tax=Mesorhizobium sp. TaxID=1871066 RepID=UPI000FE5F892|nr:ABC-three component system protein [Mesorhizobium sp.]RWB75419.1 MAG: hypothetical protein EOQ50_14135 [Mesorhizobium sp.]
MLDPNTLKPVNPKPPAATPTAAHIMSGLPVPKGVRVRSFSPDEWEEFTEEWASTLIPPFLKVRRFGGAGDYGVDIAGFLSASGFAGLWENFQCKRYDHPLRPSDIWVEIGKIIYYSYKGDFIPPQKHFFMCTNDIGTTLERLLNNPAKLKAEARANWDKHCRNGITTTVDVELTGTLLEHFNNFDFAIFSSKSVLELLSAHVATPYHTVRFGGGLPGRGPTTAPPATVSAHESRYIRQLLDAYGERDGKSYLDPSSIASESHSQRDFLRQRERFYHAESLRNFARDTVPDGTFEDLQDEVYHAVIDTCDDPNHANGFERMRATVDKSMAVTPLSNALTPALKTQDKMGICHQLANEDRLTWVVPNV